MTLTDLLRRYTQTYYRKVAFSSGLGIVIWLLGWWWLLGLEPTIGSCTTLVSMIAFAVARKPDELHRAHVLVFVYNASLVLPIALFVNDMGVWVSFGLGMALAIAAMVVCTVTIGRRMPRGVWITLPDGRDLPLDVRPFTCEDCDRVHYAFFAQRASIRVGGPETTRFALHADRAGGSIMIASLQRDTDGDVWVPVAPSGFGITSVTSPRNLADPETGEQPR